MATLHYAHIMRWWNTSSTMTRCHYNDNLCVYVWLTEASAGPAVVCCGSLISQQQEPREENQKGLHEGCDPLDTHRRSSWERVTWQLNANTSTKSLQKLRKPIFLKRSEGVPHRTVLVILYESVLYLYFHLCFSQLCEVVGAHLEQNGDVTYQSGFRVI